MPNDGEEGRHQREFQGRGQALGDEFGDRAAVLIGNAELALRGVFGKAAELDNERIVQTEAFLQLHALPRCVVSWPTILLIGSPT